MLSFSNGHNKPQAKQTDDDVFQHAFLYAKQKYEEKLDETIETDDGLELIANLLCISQIVSEEFPQYNLDLSQFDSSPKDISHPRTKILHEKFHDQTLNIVQCAMKRTPEDINSLRNEFVQIANTHEASEVKKSSCRIL